MSTLKTGKVKTTTIADELDTESTAVTNVINGSAKAWVNFNGTGAVAIRGSFNVDSITDNGTGDYTVNFSSNFSNANWSISGFAGAGTSNAAVGALQVGTNFSQSTSSIRVQTIFEGGADLTDMAYVNVQGFGNL